MLTRFYLNGQTTHVLELSHSLQAMGHAVFLIVSRLDHPGYINWLREKRIAYSRTDRPLGLLAALKRGQFDVIHNHSAHTLASSLQLSNELQIPLTATCHYLDFEPMEMLERADAVVAISDEMAAHLPISPAMIRVVENGVPIPHHVTLTGRPKKAVVLARMTPNRTEGYHSVVEELVRMGWEVTIAGNWRHPRARSIGWTQAPSKLLHQAQLVIGTGRAVREGMAAGCVGLVLGDYLDGVVTPNNVRKLRHANFSGRATKRKPTPAEIQRELSELSSTRLLSLMRFSRQYAKEHFDQKDMAIRHIQIYEEVLGRGKTVLNVK